MMIKCLIYCTKSKDYHLDCEIVNGKNKWFCWNKKSHHYPFKYVKEELGEDYKETFNGHIVAQFDCEKVDFYEMEYYEDNLVLNQISIYDEFESKEWGHDCFKKVISNEYSEEEIANCELIKKSCLSFNELGKYVCSKNGIDNFYAIHISNLEIFYEPLDLEKGGIYKDNGYRTKMVTKAPQNMQYVNDIFGRECVLISIKPEWVEKILNGSKTIEVRKSIVNKLKELI